MSDYCRSCDGYAADVGNLDESGWCERCTYRNALEVICARSALENVRDPQWASGVAQRALDAFMNGDASFADDNYADYCTAEHAWVDAGGGMLTCAVCQAERFSDEWGR